MPDSFALGRLILQYTFGGFASNSWIWLAKRSAAFTPADAALLVEVLGVWWLGIPGVQAGLASLTPRDFNVAALQLVGVAGDLVEADTLLLDELVAFVGESDDPPLPAGVCKVIHYDLPYTGRGRSARTYSWGWGQSDLVDGSQVWFKPDRLQARVDSFNFLLGLIGTIGSGLGTVAPVVRHRKPLFPSSSPNGTWDPILNARVRTQRVDYLRRQPPNGLWWPPS